MSYDSQRYADLIRNNPNVQRFLNLIGWAEGADYNVGFGNRPITSYVWHPYQQRQFTAPNGKPTSAAGKYQFVRGTWDRVASALGLKDFTPQSQDIAAVKLIDDRGALGDIINGNISSAIVKTRGEWESFAIKPLSTLVNKFYGGVFQKNLGNGSLTTGATNASMQSSADNFGQYLGVQVVTPKQRYMLAFAILLIIFVFAFN